MRNIVFIILLLGIFSVHAQNNRVMNQLAEKPIEQILVFGLERAALTQIIEATAWKMNYDSVLIGRTQDKILVFRGFPSSPVQYRMFCRLAPHDSALMLSTQSFWFQPPDSIPRYNKSMRKADRDLRKLFLFALIQEIARRHGEPLFNRGLPEKKFSDFMWRNLLNPGLASWHLMKDHPRLTAKSAAGWSLFFGMLDAGYLAFGFTAHNAPAEDQAAFFNLSNQQVAFFGAATSRLAMTVGYFVDRDYEELRKSGYYFPKIAKLSFDSKYTRYLPPPARNQNSAEN